MRRAPRSPALAAAIAVSLLLLAVAPARSGAQASAYVPLGDPAYALIDALLARGELGSLSLLERPYTAAQIQSALARDAQSPRGRVVASWRAQLQRAAWRFSPRPAPDEEDGARRASAAGASRAPTPEVLPPGDVGYIYIDALIARGLLAPVQAAPRPYEIRRLVAAIDATDTTALDSSDASRMRELRKAAARATLAPESRAADRAPDESSRPRDSVPPMAAEFAAELTGTLQSSGRRELMRADTSRGAFLGVRAWGSVVTGPLVAAARGSFDPRLKDDPEYTGRRDRKLIGRFDEAYVAVQVPVGELFVGRLARNWGPPQIDGFLIGRYAYSYDHLYLRLGRPGLHASAVLTRLDDYRSPGDTLYQRFLAAHRVALRWRGVEGSIGEAIIYGGAGRSSEAAFLNPINVYTAALFNGEGGDGNSLVTLDVALRTGASGSFAAQLLVDDLQIDQCSGGCQEPPSYGFTLSGEGLPLAGPQRWFLLYTQVANLVYRTPQPWETYTMRGIGIGRGFSDYDEARIGLDLALPSAPPLRAYLARQRIGSGDYRRQYPDVSQYATTPTFLERPLTTVVRAALSGAASWAALSIAADVGYNRVRHDDAAVASPLSPVRSGFAGRVTLALRSSRLRYAE